MITLIVRTKNVKHQIVKRKIVFIASLSIFIQTRLIVNAAPRFLDMNIHLCFLIDITTLSIFKIVFPSNGWGVLGGDYKRDRAQVSTSTLSYLHLDRNHGSLPLQLLPQKVFIFFLQMIPVWIRIYCSSHYSNTFRNAHCTLCSLCSYQLNKLIHSLEFMSRYTILHIFVPVCSVERKTWFTRKLPFSNFKLAVYLVYFNWFCVFQKCAGK